MPKKGLALFFWMYIGICFLTVVDYPPIYPVTLLGGVVLFGVTMPLTTAAVIAVHFLREKVDQRTSSDGQVSLKRMLFLLVLIPVWFAILVVWNFVRGDYLSAHFSSNVFW